MHTLAVLNHSATSFRTLLLRTRRALATWGQRQWLALCAQAERPARRVPRY